MKPEKLLRQALEINMVILGIKSRIVIIIGSKTEYLELLIQSMLPFTIDSDLIVLLC